MRVFVLLPILKTDRCGRDRAHVSVLSWTGPGKGGGGVTVSTTVQPPRLRALDTMSSKLSGWLVREERLKCGLIFLSAFLGQYTCRAIISIKTKFAHNHPG